MGIVEGSAPSEAEKEAAHGVRAGDVRAPDTPEVMDPPVGKDDGDTPGSTAALTVS
jgi:hypothetical protein